MSAATISNGVSDAMMNGAEVDDSVVAGVECLHPPSVRCDVLGVGISAVTLSSAVATIQNWIANRQHNYVCITGVHGVIESQRDAQLKAIHNSAGMVTPDGMPMVWLNHLKGHKHVTRVYGPDLMLAVCRAGAADGNMPIKHFFYGGGEGVADLLSKELRAKIPQLRVVGTYCPPFRPLTPEEDFELIEQIKQSGADIVWVGLSTPKQERWMSQHLGKLNAPVMIGVGAAFDFHAGLKKQAPAWMQKSGMEWFFRLVTEPRRLWKRYLQNNPLFVWNVLLQSLGLKNFGPIERPAKLP
jgi:N-acetylglucosaminyldiphosphoundecaprenol N-acetyl-beta-D-mannosaminyltransferase